MPADAYKAINAWLIYIGLPAVSFRYLPHIHFTTALIIPATAPLIVWCAGWLFSSFYGRATHVDKPTIGCLKLSTGLSNTSFLGFPLVAAYFGERYIGIAVICDQVTFLLLATAAIVVAVRSSGDHHFSFRNILLNVFSFPAFPACLLALILPKYIDISALEPLFDKLALTVPPLALFSIGLQLQFRSWRGEIKHLTAALICKLFIAPLVVLLVILITHSNGIEARVGLFETCTPTLVSSGIVAAEYRLNPKLSSLIIGAGIIIGLFTTALWYLLIDATIPL